MSAPATLVTGAAGFVAGWLIPALEAAGHRVMGTHRRGQRSHARQSFEVELSDAAVVDALIAELRPATVVHLAALASPRDATRSPLDAIRDNYLSVDRLARALARHAPGARWLHVSSGAVYGGHAQGEPSPTEEEALLPGDAYAASRVAAERRVALAIRDDGIDALVARAFNHSGPGRGAAYAESSFARQLVAIERREAPAVLRVGNLEGARDFSDVRDVVEAYLLLIERGEPAGVYNVASGDVRSLRDILLRLIELSGVTPRIEVDPERYRPADPGEQVISGNAARLRELGWAPRHDSLLQSVAA